MKGKIAIWPSLLLIVMFLDLLSTYYSVPDLKNERNWLVSKLGFNWLAFIVTYLFTGIIEIILYYIHLCSYKYKWIEIISIKSYFSNVIKIAIFNKVILGKNKFLNGLINLFGYSVIRLSFLLKLIATISNIIEGYAQKHYIFEYGGNNTYYAISRGSSLKQYPILENIAFKWLEMEDLVEEEYDIYIRIILSLLIFMFFIQFEIKRMTNKIKMQRTLHLNH
ncbi:hypothetical protein [Spirosoma sp. 209]|uniref:hypothetical protein n=1 Tax=Spirosoma sp. 209 TaxID=1955701 RepID=UPI00098D5F90|nr:hypothetical protein [Spirosoma sp. 209]